MTDNQPTEAMVDAVTDAEHAGSVAMGDSTPEWRYEIKHGPDGEANYAWLYHRADMVAVMKTHDAVALTGALSRPAQEPVAGYRRRLPQYSFEHYEFEQPDYASPNIADWEPLYAAPQPIHGTSSISTLQSPDKERGETPAPAVLSRGDLVDKLTDGDIRAIAESKDVAICRYRLRTALSRVFAASEGSSDGQ